jgi:hypothetical protein
LTVNIAHPCLQLSFTKSSLMSKARSHSSIPGTRGIGKYSDGRGPPQVLEDQRRLGAGHVGVGVEVFHDE